MKDVLLIVAASFQKQVETKSLLTHMVYFSVAMGCKSLVTISVLVWRAHYHLYLFVCTCNCCTSCCDIYQHATDSLLMDAFGLCKCEWQWYCWGELRGQAERSRLCVCVCGCDKILKPRAQNSSVLAVDWRHWRGRVAAAHWKFLPISPSFLLLETGLFHSLLDLIYIFCKALNNTGSWHYACFGTERMQGERSNGPTK